MTFKRGLMSEFALLGLLALLWGASYPLLKIAVAEIPPMTLIALRVSGAAAFLGMVMAIRGDRLPPDARSWRMLLVQAIFNSIGAWTLLAWGQQYVDASLASVLNSTSPIFAFLFTALGTGDRLRSSRKLAGACFGMFGVVLIVGVDALDGLGQEIAGQTACLISAALYAGAAIHGRRFGHFSPAATATGTMIWAALILLPMAVVIDQPWSLSPSASAVGALILLSVACTGIALSIYFRLVRTIGAMGVASQAYLRAGIGVFLGGALLGETISPLTGAGLLAAVVGVAVINWPHHEQPLETSGRLRDSVKAP